MAGNRLLPEDVFQKQQEGNKQDEEDQYPSGTFVLLLLPFPVFAVHPDHNQDEDQDKCQGKNDLTGGEHISTFSAKLTQTNPTMKQKIAAVAEFHRAFGLGIKDHPSAGLPLEKNLLRYKLMREENEEYLDAASRGDLV